MEIVNKDFKDGYAVKFVSYYLHVSFLETCKSYGWCPAGLNIRQKSVHWVWKWQFDYPLEGDFVKCWEWFVGGSLCGDMWADVLLGKKSFGTNHRNSIKIT